MGFVPTALVEYVVVVVVVVFVVGFLVVVVVGLPFSVKSDDEEADTGGDSSYVVFSDCCVL